MGPSREAASWRFLVSDPAIAAQPARSLGVALLPETITAGHAGRIAPPSLWAERRYRMPATVQTRRAELQYRDRGGPGT
jgi:hypothetical protein